jgi:hypothetical protein
VLEAYTLAPFIIAFTALATVLNLAYLLFALNRKNNINYCAELERKEFASALRELNKTTLTELNKYIKENGDIVEYKNKIETLLSTVKSLPYELTNINKFNKIICPKTFCDFIKSKKKPIFFVWLHMNYFCGNIINQILLTGFISLFYQSIPIYLLVIANVAWDVFLVICIQLLS